MPPELVGAHVGPTHSHTTGRVHDIAFRVITALFGHFGMEWDIRRATAEEGLTLRRGIGLYKRHRELLHSGLRVNADVAEPNLALHGVVAHDGGEGLFAAVALGTIAAEMPGRVGIPGLDPDREYRVDVALPTAEDGDWNCTFTQLVPPPWVTEGATASGRFLAEVGLPLPILRPEHALLLHATALS